MNHRTHQLIAAVESAGYQHLVFDLDETLARLDVPWGELIDSITALMAYQGPEQFQRLRSNRGTGWSDIINARLSQRPELIDQYLAICTAFETKHLNYTPNTALVAALPTLATGRRLALWTSNVRPTAERVLSELAVRHLFTDIVAREDVLLMKPHPEAWPLIYEPNSDLSSYLFVGDSLNDREAAAAVGIRYFHIDHFK